MKRVLVVAMVLVGLVAMVAIAADEGPIKIGVVLPMSPPGAYASGNPAWWAVLQAVQEINEAGGIFGREVVAVLGDTRGLPEEARAVTERLITKDNVVGVVGNYHSSCALAELDLFQSYHIPYIGAEPWSDDVTALGYDEVFRIAITNSMYTDIVIEFMKAAGFKRIAAIHEITDYALGLEKKLTAAWEAAGIESKIAFCDVKTEDFTPTLIQFKQWNPPPDLIFGNVTGPGAFLLIKQAYDIGLGPSPTTAFFGSNSCLNPEVWEVAGEAAKYILVTQIGLPPSAATEVTNRENEKFQAAYGRLMNSSIMEGYDSFMLMCEAIKFAGSTNADAIIDALEVMEWTGMRGKYYFPYGSKNPVPEGVPAYMWHQWPDVSEYLFQYTEVGQDFDEGTVIWPTVFSELPDGQYFIPVPEEE